MLIVGAKDLPKKFWSNAWKQSIAKFSFLRWCFDVPDLLLTSEF
jgi:hypothetical protein